MKPKKKLILQLVLLLFTVSMAILIIQKTSIKATGIIENSSQKTINEGTSGDLTYQHLVKTYTPGDAANFIKQAGKGTTAESAKWSEDQLGSPKYSVDAYIIEYISIDHNGNKIPVSGVVLIPQKANSMPILVYQYATILEKSKSPSESITSASGQSNTLLGSFACDGYIVAMSDFVGTGQPNCLKYPSEYLYAKSEAANGVDMLTATKQLLEKLKVTTNGQLFLSGYSEGGQAVSALANLIQSDYPQYPVTAAVFMEGPYNMSAVMNNLLETPGGVILDGAAVGSLICAKAIYAYQNIYNWGTIESIFNEPYATRVQNDFSKPNTSMIKLAMDFPKDTDKMFNASFLDSAKTGTASTDIAANNTDNWVPKMPVTFLTSTADTLIPGSVTQATYEKMLDNGGNVTMGTTQFPLNHLQNYFQAIVQSKGIFDGYLITVP